MATHASEVNDINYIVCTTSVGSYAERVNRVVPCDTSQLSDHMSKPVICALTVDQIVRHSMTQVSTSGNGDSLGIHRRIMEMM